MSNKFGSVQVHRFGVQVSAHLGLKVKPSWGRKKVEGVTAYMSPKEARDFAWSLIRTAEEIENGVHFTESRVGTYSAGIEGDRIIERP